MPGNDASEIVASIVSDSFVAGLVKENQSVIKTLFGKTLFGKKENAALLSAGVSSRFLHVYSSGSTRDYPLEGRKAAHKADSNLSLHALMSLRLRF